MGNGKTGTVPVSGDSAPVAVMVMMGASFGDVGDVGGFRRVVPGRPGPGTVPLFQVVMAGSDLPGCSS